MYLYNYFYSTILTVWSATQKRNGNFRKQYFYLKLKTHGVIVFIGHDI